MEQFWNRDPCGTHGSGVIGKIPNTALSGRVSKPVLLVYAEFDEIFDSASYEQYRDRYTGSNDVTLAIVREAGHAFFAENADKATESQDIVSAWLTARGF
jgi:dienelactone hydrolase